MTRRRGFSLRTKLLLVAISLLALPYVGLEYVREMEAHLRGALEDSVRVAGQAVAGALQSQAPHFKRALPSGNQEIHAHSLPAAPQLDGYANDWISLVEVVEKFRFTGGQRPSDVAWSLAGRFGGYLYILVRVHDDNVVFPSPLLDPNDGGDYLDFLLADPSGISRRYRVTTLSPGTTTVMEIPYSGYRKDAVHREYRMVAFWQLTAEGYDVELRIPLNLLGNRLGFVVGDVDNAATRELRSWSATVNRGGAEPPGALVFPAPAIDRVVTTLGNTPGRRVTVVDRFGTVRARVGSLQRPNQVRSVNPLYAFILRPAKESLSFERSVATRMTSNTVKSALRGQTAVEWRQTQDADISVVSAAIPIADGTELLGAVVVEESTLAIQFANRQALASLLNKTLLAAGLGALTLLLFASRISSRLRKLRDEAESAIDDHGRVVKTIAAARSGDEIGDLSRSFAALSVRLRDYNRYLEQLARRLSHELRTPLAIVRSSLDNLELETKANGGDVFTRRAREGVERLDAIISRMGESSRLEQAMQTTELSRTDIGEFVSKAVAGYSTAWPGESFHAELPGQPLFALVSTDLMMQMLDKLVANARDFNPGNREIRIQVTSQGAWVNLSVINFDAKLPPGQQSNLFESMVSVREKTGDNTPHLGLGLFIARMISDFHRGRIFAENLRNPPAVRITAMLPRSSQD